MLPSQKETGMLLQNKFGLLSAFLYNHDFMLKHHNVFERFMNMASPNCLVPFAAKYAEMDLKVRFGDVVIDPGMEVLLNLMADYNSSALHQFVRAIMDMYKNGIHGMQPSEVLCESMALTQANYDASEFHLPYPTTIIELPLAFRSSYTLRPFLEEMRMLPNLMAAANQYWKTDFEQLGRDGLPPRYIIMMEHQHDEIGVENVPNFQKFVGATANRTLTVVMASDLSFKKMLCPILKAILNNQMREVRIMNPMSFCVFQRPLYRGVTMHDVLTTKTGIKNDGSVYSVDMMDSEQHSMIQMSLLCVNICHALTHMGMETEKVAHEKLQRRGSPLAQRVIPTIIAPAITIINEARRSSRTDDGLSESTGKVVSPHYRIGHFRRQHYGSGGIEIKTVWIAPTLVNKHLLANPNACAFAKKQKDFDNKDNS